MERRFGEMKTKHGLGRCWYVHLLRYAIQGYLTVVVTIKRIVKLVFGVSLRNQSYPLAQPKPLMSVAA